MGPRVVSACLRKAVTAAASVVSTAPATTALATGGAFVGERPATVDAFAAFDDPAALGPRVLVADGQVTRAD